MKFFPDRTTFVSIGSLSIQWYAVLILAGAFIAYFFSKINLKKYRNIDVYNFFDDIFIYMLWGGVIFARIWYVLFDSTYNYLENPIQIVRIWDGGLAFHGCFIGGLLVAVIFCKIKNVSLLKFCDAVFPTVLIAQAIGRWGNFVNQECYGQTVSASYFDGVLSFLKNDMFILGEYREPMFFYESILCFVGFIIINFVLRHFQKKRGELVWAYLIWYGFIRFFIEARRTDSLLISNSGLKTAQVVSILFILVGILGELGEIDKLFKPKKPTILFDLDGTLQDSEKSIIKTYEELFRRHDKLKNFTKERKVEVLGPSLYDIFPKFFPDCNPDELYNEYQQIINTYLPILLKPMPHAMDVLKKLKEKGYTIGVVTTRARESCEYCFNITHMDKYIDDMICFNDVKRTKPDIEAYYKIINKNKWNKDDIVIVGDSHADIKAGVDFGAYTIAYITRKEKEARIMELNPNKVIKGLKEIPEILEENHYYTYNLK